uniref:protease inhibitor Inh/omp19 family protein n=1 Tax=Pararhizobium sp. IMCC3301 TaxID=3067904 RepID=UPI0027421350|nr:protease inhibitor Inh/omp19 family protein [Pararhizobium sp. IMCC3301]
MSGQNLEAATVKSARCSANTGNKRALFTGPGFVKSAAVRSGLVVLAATFLLAACQTRLPNPFSGASKGRVQTGELPPLASSDSMNSGQAFDPNAQAPMMAQPSPEPFDAGEATNSASAQLQTPTADHTVQSAAPLTQPVQPAASSVQLSRADMLGAWQLAAASDNCQLFMTLTTWTGGYRATTKGCSSTELSNITAWDLENNRVVLVGATGTQVASLVSAGGNRFSGQTNSGAQVSVSR